MSPVGAQLLAAVPNMDLATRKSLVEEVLRWSSTTMHFRRTVTTDTQLRDVTLREGDKVVLWYVSANYDDAQFADPYTFDPLRQPNEHVAFGLHSPHLCLGAHLARLELRVLFEEMAAAWRDVQQTGPTERFRSNFISGVKRLPVSVTWK